MAAAQHNLTRRALLGAVLVAPVIPRHPGLDPGSTFVCSGSKGRWTPDQVRGDDKARILTNWDRALARYARADAAAEAVKGRGDDRLYDRLLGGHNKALARLLRTPAPHLAALAEKLVLSEVEGLDLLVAHQVWELNFAQPSLAALRRDARRLASGTRSS